MMKDMHFTLDISREKKDKMIDINLVDEEEENKIGADFLRNTEPVAEKGIVKEIEKKAAPDILRNTINRQPVGDETILDILGGNMEDENNR